TTRGCAPLIVRFSDISTGNPLFWRWDLGNGAVSFAKNPSTTYFAPGTYSVKLYCRNNNSDADSLVKMQYITVFASPVVNFKSSDTAGCFPLRINFSDLSTPGTGNIIRWEWDFGDGTTDSVQNPTHIYSELGKYNVTLRVRNSNGCFITLSKGNYINVNNGVKAVMDLSVPDNCRPPALVNFKNLSSGTGQLTYKWNFGDGITSTSPEPAHSYSLGGSYAVKLTVQNNFGCIDSVEKLNAVTIGTVRADFSMPENICAGKTVSVINTSSPVPVTAHWTFGQGMTSDSFHTSIVYNTPGIYTIKLLSDFGTCRDSVVKTIQVLPKPRSAFGSNKPAACKGPLTVDFINQSENAVTYLWLFGDGGSSTNPRPSHLYSQRGSYDVTLITTGSNGCSDTLIKPAFVKILPPSLGMLNLPAKGCAPLTFQPKYNLQSVDQVVSMQWDFGEGAIASGFEPIHQYTKPGVFTIKVTLITKSGCVDSFQFVNSVQVGLLPQVNFSATPHVACAYQPIFFNDLTTGDPLTEWTWDFGDNGTSHEQNPSHIYSDTGYFTVKLKVSSNGCENEISLPDLIFIRPPIARFLDSSGCSTPLSSSFKDSSIGAKSWFWDFGDSTTSTDKNPDHIFPRSGTYFVSLTVTNDTCENTIRRQVRIVNEIPDFTISASDVCKGASVNFQSRNINRSNISSQTWLFGDGTTAGFDSIISHTYNTSGIFSIALAITDIKGCRDTLKKDLYLKVSGPAANFTSGQPAVCVNGTISFTDLSKADPGQPISHWVWNYGDGASENLSSPPFSHAYSTSGNMLVSLKVVDSKGCTDSITKPGLIFISKPQASFLTADTITCLNGLVSFLNTSTGNPVAAVWNFGDQSNPSMALQTTHRYLTEGKFDVSLAITDRYGCKDATSKPAYIAVRNPKSVFSISDTLATCPPLVSTFTNNSLNYNAFEWDFGDGNRSTQTSPVHFYNLAGIFNSRLIVSSPGGCRDTSYGKLLVRGPQGDFVYDKVSGCTPLKIKFTAQTKDNVSFIWDYNDGTTDATPDSIVDHQFVIRGKYLPRMILIDPQGCKVPIIARDSISVFGVDAKPEIDKTIICDSGVAYFRDASVSNDVITSYLWNFGDGTTSILKSPSHLYVNPGNYPVNLSVTTLNGCTDDADKPVAMQVIATPVTSITGPAEACVP
ncbi:MAG: PKD domain-containing protein, partial [Chitinophagaceae bacterium]